MIKYIFFNCLFFIVFRKTEHNFFLHLVVLTLCIPLECWDSLVGSRRYSTKIEKARRYFGEEISEREEKTKPT